MADKKPKHRRGKQKKTHSQLLNGVAQAETQTKKRKVAGNTALRDIQPQVRLTRVTRSKDLAGNGGRSQKIGVASVNGCTEARAPMKAVEITREGITNTNSPNSNTNYLHNEDLPDSCPRRDEAMILDRQSSQTSESYQHTVYNPALAEGIASNTAREVTDYSATVREQTGEPSTATTVLAISDTNVSQQGNAPRKDGLNLQRENDTQHNGVSPDIMQILDGMNKKLQKLDALDSMTALLKGGLSSVQDKVDGISAQMGGVKSDLQRCEEKWEAGASALSGRIEILENESKGMENKWESFRAKVTKDVAIIQPSIDSNSSRILELENKVAMYEEKWGTLEALEKTIREAAEAKFHLIQKEIKEEVVEEVSEI